MLGEFSPLTNSLIFPTFHITKPETFARLVARPFELEMKSGKFSLTSFVERFRAILRSGRFENPKFENVKLRPPAFRATFKRWT